MLYIYIYLSTATRLSSNYQNVLRVKMANIPPKHPHGSIIIIITIIG